MDLKDLTPEQLEKVRGCDSADELIGLAKAEGVELTDEQLDMIAGGLDKDWFDHPICPNCGERVVTYSDGTFWCSYCDLHGSQ